MKYHLLIIVIVAFLVRLYGITTPAADWHAFRQADTASVTREYVKHGIDFLHPRYQDLGSLQSGKDNLDGYRMVEFPLVNAFIAVIIRAVPAIPLVPFSRLVSVFFSLGTLVSLYYLVKHLSGKSVAILTALAFALIPYSVFYSRTILPEPAMLFFSTFSFLAFAYWLRNKKWWWYLTTFVSLIVALLLKPSVAFVLPVYAGLVLWTELPLKELTFKYLFFRGLYYLLLLVPAFLVSVLPLVAWRQWITQFPSGIPALDWLFNSNLIRFRPAWFRWLFYERLTKLILGYVGLLFLPFNLFSKNKDLLVYGAWWVGILIYFSVIATGNVQHDYYQVLAMPIIAISIGRGMDIAYHFLHRWLPSLTIGFLFLGLAGMSLWYAWQHVSGYYNVNHWEYLRAGQAVDELTPSDAKVIAPAFGDTQFLFQTNRTGWPLGWHIEDKIAKGATHYVSTSYDDEARLLESQYQVLKKTDEFILIDLTAPIAQP